VCLAELGEPIDRGTVLRSIEAIVGRTASSAWLYVVVADEEPPVPAYIGETTLPLSRWGSPLGGLARGTGDIAVERVDARLAGPCPLSALAPVRAASAIREPRRTATALAQRPLEYLLRDRIGAGVGPGVLVAIWPWKPAPDHVPGVGAHEQNECQLGISGWPMLKLVGGEEAGCSRARHDPSAVHDRLKPHAP
jgi:hypothetical protein